jgi:hypothetical protein
MMKLRSEHSKSLRTLQEGCKTVDADNKGIREQVTELELTQSVIAKQQVLNCLS